MCSSQDLNNNYVTNSYVPTATENFSTKIEKLEDFYLEIKQNIKDNQNVIELVNMTQTNLGQFSLFICRMRLKQKFTFKKKVKGSRVMI